MDPESVVGEAGAGEGDTEKLKRGAKPCLWEVHGLLGSLELKW